MQSSKRERGPRRWRQWREADAREVLAAWTRSGQSLAAFAREKGYSLSRLHRWRARLAAGDVVHFVPVTTTTPAAATLEVVVRGVVLRAREDVAPPQLAALVAALATALPPC